MTAGIGDTRADAVPVARMRHAAAKRIQDRFPGIWAWYGLRTGSYWAFVRRRDGDRLVEASTPDGLSQALMHVVGSAGWR
ncbi:hypothetical protein [Actinomadura atramentaria]|uniref:hypothetical protein n=1 Tax=Actinomadura atramentaria TaxID=1990 RepID=UPI000365C01C|nr:hypothetical protein [Actinomadura atramentaria]